MLTHSKRERERERERESGRERDEIAATAATLSLSLSPSLFPPSLPPLSLSGGGSIDRSQRAPRRQRGCGGAGGGWRGGAPSWGSISR